MCEGREGSRCPQAYTGRRVRKPKHALVLGFRCEVLLLVGRVFSGVSNIHDWTLFWLSVILYSLQICNMTMGPKERGIHI